MATVSTLARAVGGKGNPGRKVYVVEKEIDLAAAATAKGSALAAADIIQAITVPAGALIVNAGMECTATPAGGTGTVLDLGVTGVDVDVFVDGFAFDSATAGDYAQNAAAFQPVVIGTEDTIDVLIQAASTVSTSGKVRVWAVLVDVSEIGVTEGAIADRDQLA
jgi:hypothetical protein